MSRRHQRKANRFNALKDFDDDTLSSRPIGHEQRAWEESTLATFATSDKAQVRKHLEDYVFNDVSGNEPWLAAQELPNEQEIGWIVNGEVQVPRFLVKPNKPEGPFESKEEYLKIHAELMRNDGLSPLREAVDEFRMKTGMVEAESEASTRIYENVYIIGLTAARGGLALKVEFSTRRAERLIRWAQSKRLKTGTLVALSPVRDMFESKCIVAVVASRLVSALDVKSPAKPSIQLYVSASEQLEIDPQQEFIMVEAISGYWEAYRHTYQALKKLYIESFPLAEHIISLQTNLSSPQYRINSPILNLTSAAKENKELVRSLNILEDWPSFVSKDNYDSGSDSEKGVDNTQAVSYLDNSQIEALRRVLTQQLAIVQGPPGTGKTFVSVIAIKILVENMQPNDPPIIVTAQTNHALDQLLRLISIFEPNFIRLGGQTADEDIIKPRTMYEVKQHNKVKMSTAMKRSIAQHKSIEKALSTLLEPLTSNQPITPELCQQYGLISKDQRDSILHSESAFVGYDAENMSPMEIWCDNNIAPAKKRRSDFAFGQYEEFEGFEKLDEEDLEAHDVDDERFETLKGRFFTLSNGYKSTKAGSVPDSVINHLLQKHQDLREIPASYRGAMYDFFRRSITDKVTAAIREHGEEAQRLAKHFKIGRWEADHEVILNTRTRVIGMTTTGLSKYRGLVTSLKPKIVLIEEAAETLEAYVAAACFESLEHLILVGDHQQLRGHCVNSELEGDPAHFDMSMFERLVKNNIPFTQLKTQRRMRPEIRELIMPIYSELDDHLSVLKYEDVPGMGGNNVHFFHHQWEEANDDMLSKQNNLEARMVVAFYSHLVYNGLDPKQITILTFYNGQVRFLRKLFRSQHLLQGHRINIHTVDSYQGEENDIVLLSLVRNNRRQQIGFLNNINRACVSLSRAKRGFYLFGHAGLLAECNDKWKEILMVLMSRQLIQMYLPLQCTRHSNVYKAEVHTDFDDLHGGCKEVCGQSRSCGHPCKLNCHPFPCDAGRCEEECENVMQCGHPCSRGCGIKPCRCDPCFRQVDDNVITTATAKIPTPTKKAVAKGKKVWAGFAGGGYKEADAKARDEIERNVKKRTEHKALYKQAVEKMEDVEIDDRFLPESESPPLPPTNDGENFPTLPRPAATGAKNNIGTQLANTDAGQSVGVKPSNAFPTRTPIVPSYPALDDPLVDLSSDNAPLAPHSSNMGHPPGLAPPHSALTPEKGRKNIWRDKYVVPSGR